MDESRPLLGPGPPPPSYEEKQQPPSMVPAGQWQPQPAPPQPQPVQPMPVPGPEWQQGPPPVMITQQVQPSFVTIQTPACLSAYPTTTLCPHCHQMVTTEIYRENGGPVLMMALVLCLIGVVCLLCCLGLIPFCIPSLKDTVHICPNCKTVLGKHVRE